ncbi:hypothetical protein FT663_02070 [Candidozyma haemuli var. vulneris]|uniref:Uncharacterized protein n=1 Tax=Candidozyma haemuli TaxID=45357 RepID=A0A2V1AMB3_9ASCO|nr:hypothetical protein CXQ85_001271 [[Candida] haemuloni]KAF3989951.1 hypothetical protein FT662_02515 [[Candida] haemuloni var. vulneris]KAF3993061.1 hypothetical protein FT663_02070 [[Candida] haemuloni var. vulneris]PVH18978.1 hypothetical protein CXQ85_001271 [[Candida] haemuloni]
MDTSATPAVKEEEDENTIVPSSPAPPSIVEENASGSPDKEKAPAEDGEQDKKKRKTATKASRKPSEEVLQRRREGRIKAAATIAQNLKKTGIGRFEEHNGFKLTAVKTVPLINQKNYYADYLKKDEQATLIRNWRNEKVSGVSSVKGPKSAGSDKKTEEDDEDDEDDDNDDNDNDDNDDEDNENATGDQPRVKVKMGHDTIVIQPGSSFIRLGRATDSTPVAVPAVVAYKRKDGVVDKHEKTPLRTETEDGEYDFGTHFDEMKAVVTKDFKARMRYYKRRVQPNSRESAADFNRKQTGEPISEHNEPSTRNWLSRDDELLEKHEFIAGSKALDIPISDSFSQWHHRFPIVNGTFNQSTKDYSSPQELFGDIIRLTQAALEQINVGKSPQELANLKCLLVIPDLYDKAYVETWCDLLLHSVCFGKVGIIQEAVAATFGAGASSACVVDVGSEITTISCVDEGMIINDSRIRLDYGGKQVTEALTKLLLQQQFPYRDIDLSSFNDDWQLAETIKHNYATFNDADIAVQLYDFYKRKPGKETEKFLFKVFDEVMLAPLGLFYPDLFEIAKEHRERPLLPESFDQYTGEPNNPYSKAHENLQFGSAYSDMTDEALLVKLAEEKANSKQASAPKALNTQGQIDTSSPVTAPLDKAIIESITNAGISTDFGKAKKLYDNLLVVGGGLAKIDNFDVLLNDRINIWRPKFLSTSTLDDVLVYVSKEKDKMDNRRKQMIEDAKKKKAGSSSIDEVELTEDELATIHNDTQLYVDLDRADGLSDQGQVVAINVLPPPKDYDPRELTWKGAGVFGRLKVASEMWITAEDWELLNSRTLYYKSLFNY